MGFCGLYLKHAYTVEANFYMHTDWLMFARKVLNITGHNLDRIHRMFRFFYKSFDRVFVLNSDQKKWLTGKDMNLEEERIFLTSHWVNRCFYRRKINRPELFGITNDTPLLLYVGRISNEKGVLELPSIYRQVKDVHIDALS